MHTIIDGIRVEFTHTQEEIDGCKKFEIRFPFEVSILSVRRALSQNSFLGISMHKHQEHYLVQDSFDPTLYHWKVEPLKEKNAQTI